MLFHEIPKADLACNIYCQQLRRIDKIKKDEVNFILDGLDARQFNIQHGIAKGQFWQNWKLVFIQNVINLAGIW